MIFDANATIILGVLLHQVHRNMTHGPHIRGICCCRGTATFQASCAGLVCCKEISILWAHPKPHLRWVSGVHSNTLMNRAVSPTRIGNRGLVGSGIVSSSHENGPRMVAHLGQNCNQLFVLSDRRGTPPPLSVKPARARRRRKRLSV